MSYDDGMSVRAQWRHELVFWLLAVTWRGWR